MFTEEGSNAIFNPWLFSIAVRIHDLPQSSLAIWSLTPLMRI